MLRRGMSAGTSNGVDRNIFAPPGRIVGTTEVRSALGWPRSTERVLDAQGHDADARRWSQDSSPRGEREGVYSLEVSGGSGSGSASASGVLADREGSTGR